MMSSRAQHFHEYTENGISKPMKYFEGGMDLGNGQLYTYKCGSETQMNSHKKSHGVGTLKVKCTRCDKDSSNQVTYTYHTDNTKSINAVIHNNENVPLALSLYIGILFLDIKPFVQLTNCL